MSKMTKASQLVRILVIYMQLHPEEEQIDLTHIAKKHYTTLNSARSSFAQIAQRMGGGVTATIRGDQVFYVQEVPK